MLKSGWVGVVFAVGKQGNWIKSRRWKGARQTEGPPSCRLNSPMSPPTPSIALMWPALVPYAKPLRGDASPEEYSHKYTQVASFNFGWITAKILANNNVKKNVLMQKSEKRWLICLSHRHANKGKNNIKHSLSHHLDAVRWETFMVFSISLFVTFEEPLQNRPRRCLRKAQA